MRRPSASRLRALSGSETGRAAELGIAVMVGNVVALGFTVVFTRVLDQAGYGSLGALISTFLILTVAGYALQTTVAREVSGALAAGDADAARGVRRWLKRLSFLTVGAAVVGVLAREPLATVIGVPDVPWAAAATLPAGALFLVVSVERGALLGYERYRMVGASIVGEQLARLAVGVALAVAGLDVTGAFLGTPLSLAVVALVLWVPLRRQIGPGPGVEREGHRLRDLILRAWAPICALGLISWLQDGNVIVVKHLASDHDAGAWVAAAVAAKAIMWVAIGLGAYVVAETARSAAKGDARPVLLRTIGLIAVLAVPMVLVYTVAAKPILSTLLNVEGATGALPLFGLAMSLLALTYLATQFQLGLHHSRFLVVLATAAVAQPVIMIGIGADLTALALGLAAMHLAVAAAMLTLSLRRRPPAYAAEAAPERSDDPARAVSPVA